MKDGIRFDDAITRQGRLDLASFSERYDRLRHEKSRMLQLVYDHSGVPIKAFEEYYQALDFLKDFVADTARILKREIDLNMKDVLFEGAQANLLDVDFGTYDHVSSSSCGTNGIHSGTGVRVPLENIVGVCKAYTTRVGDGGFPTEFGGRESEEHCKVKENSVETELEMYDVPFSKEGDKVVYDKNDPKIMKMMGSDDEFTRGVALRLRAAEYGTTTNRPRRTGWFDAVAVAYSIRTLGVNQIALTKQQPLDDFPVVKIATKYQLEDDPEPTPFFPSRERDLVEATPIYETMEGWQGPTESITDPTKLPRKLWEYIRRIEKLLRVPVQYLSTGPGRMGKMELYIS
jgi:adenylosuccinate synthase